MFKMVFVALYPEMARIAREEFASQSMARQGENSRAEYSFYVIDAESRSTDEVIHELKGDSDVLIARGGFVHDLHEKGYAIPVVEIQIAGSDLIRALKKAKLHFPSAPVGIIGSDNMLTGIGQVSQALDLCIRPYCLKANTIVEVKSMVDEAEKDGMRVILGGLKSTKYAASRGLKSLLLESGRESIRHAISQAFRIARSNHIEKQKAQTYKTIIDSAYEGIIVVNQANRIIMFNNAARKILGIYIQEGYENIPIDAVLPESGLKTAAKRNGEFFNEVLRFNNLQLSVNKVDLRLDGEIFGAVLTLQDITKIEEMERKIRGLVFSSGHTAKYRFNDIIGNSAVIQETKEIARLYAKHDSNILLVGETGTGKELFAQSIHNAGARAGQPFVAVNCATLQDNLLESELFGYADGAFTGARKGGKKGLFELAHNGSIFLDEISEISTALQARLLRVIQEQEVRRLGHDRIIPINVRVLSSSNRDLGDLIREGRFRRDLYYRLNVFRINIPPLRERKQDIMLIAKHYIRGSIKENKFINGAEAADEEALKQYDWPGNIRELKNICERYAAYRISFPESSVHPLSSFIDGTKGGWEVRRETSPNQQGIKERMRQSESSLITAYLREYGYNRGKVAEKLGISRQTLWRRMKRLGLNGEENQHALRAAPPPASR